MQHLYPTGNGQGGRSHRTYRKLLGTWIYHSWRVDTPPLTLRKVQLRRNADNRQHAMHNNPVRYKAGRIRSAAKCKWPRDKCVPATNAMAHPQVRESRKGWFSSLGVGRGANVLLALKNYNVTKRIHMPWTCTYPLVRPKRWKRGMNLVLGMSGACTSQVHLQ